MRAHAVFVGILVTFMLLAPSLSPASLGAECTNHFRDIHWLLTLDDDYGSCRMENAPLDGEYPPESIPFRLRNGREICARSGTEFDREYQWKHGKRLSGIFYGSGDASQDGDAVMKLDFRDASIPSGPVRVFRDGKLFCEIPIDAQGKVTGIVKEYHADGRLAWAARLFDGKEKGAAVRYDVKGMVTSFSCEEKPVFDGDKERCGFDGRPATVELTQGRGRRIVTHLKGKLMAEETISRNGEREVKRYPDGDSQTVQIEKYHKSGKLHQRYTRKGDKLDGRFEEFYESGKRAEEGRAAEGRIVELKQYYMNGSQKVVATVSPDASLCAARLYSSDGSLEVEGTFKAKRGGVDWDIPHGRVISYQEDGKLCREGNYVNGVPQGSHTFHLKQGQKAEILFEKGKPKRLREFSAGGAQIKESEVYDDGSVRELLRFGRYY